MNIKFSQARFFKSAQTLGQCPPEHGAEVAFAGRSNAGKSSALNKLTNNKNLARTSKTPGRTQLINFFQIGDNQDLRLVDLPGYGYAKVPKEVKAKWEKHLSEYLHERKSLRGLILLMDIRHPMQDLDVMMINWAVESDMPVHTLLTKSDKLKRGPAKSALLKFQRDIKTAGVDDLITAQTFSATTGEGVTELSSKLNEWFSEDKRAAARS